MGEYCWKIEKKDSAKNNGDRILGALNILGNLFDSLQWKFIHTAEREKYWNQQFQKSYEQPIIFSIIAPYLIWNLN